LEDIRRLDERYDEWLATWPGLLIEVDAALRDFRCGAEIEALASQVRAELGRPVP